MGVDDPSACPVSALRAATDESRWADVLAVLESHWADLVTSDLELVAESLTALPSGEMAAAPRWIAAKAWVEHRLRGASTVAFRNIVPDVAHGATLDRMSSLTIRIAGRRNEGDLAGARDDVERARSIGRDTPDDELATVRHALPVMTAQWARVYELSEDYDAARTLLQESFDLATLMDDGVSVRTAAGRMSWLDALEGRHSDAVVWRARAESRPARSERLDTELTLARALHQADLLRVDDARLILDSMDEESAHPESWASRLFVEAHVVDADRAPALLDRLLREESAHPRGLTSAGQILDLLAQTKVRLLLSMEDPRGALVSVDGLSSTPATRLARATAMLANDENHAVASLTRELEPDIARHPRWRAKLFAVQAVAFARLGDVASSIRASRRALETVERLGLYSALTLLSVSDLDRLELAVPDAEDTLRLVRGFASDRDHLPLSQLSDRERVVLRLIGQGLSTVDIAAELFVSRNTVKAQTTSIIRKLGVGHRSRLVAIGRSLPPERLA